jgi:hypothetical protein
MTVCKKKTGVFARAPERAVTFECLLFSGTAQSLFLYKLMPEKARTQACEEWHFLLYFCAYKVPEEHAL